VREQSHRAGGIWGIWKDETMRDQPANETEAPVAVILMGASAHDFAPLVARAGRLVAVARVDPRDEGADEAGLPRYADLGAALAAHPEARLAASLPPRDGLAVALRLAAEGRRGVIDAALPPTEEIPDGAAGVQVAHGLVTLPGLRWLGRGRPGRIAIEVRGHPERGDLPDRVHQAAALVLRLAPGARVASARARGLEGLEATLVDPDGRTIGLEVGGGRPALDVVASDGRRLQWRPDEEVLADGRRTVRRRIPSVEARALHQLLDPAAAAGDDLRAGVAAGVLSEQMLRAAGLMPTVWPAALRRAAAIQAARPGALLDRLGLVGPSGTGAPPAPVAEAPLPPEPLELFAFRAGLKPVVFLTVRPESVATVLAYFGDVHVERRDRRVEVSVQDTWRDARDRGDPRVELYLSRDAEAARRAARLQADGDPTAALAELGALMGYPPCCVAAFAAQPDRSNNTWNRYATVARTPPGPWYGELNNLSVMLVPFFPCAYRCDAARAFARGVLEAMATTHPETTKRLCAHLSRPVLYFDHAHHVILDGGFEGGRLHHAGAFTGPDAPPAFRRLAGLLAEGDGLELDDARLVVCDGGRARHTWTRIDPGLGLLPRITPVNPI
jgi:hypothetical protein